MRVMGVGGEMNILMVRTEGRDDGQGRRDEHSDGECDLGTEGRGDGGGWER